MMNKVNKKILLLCGINISSLIFTMEPEKITMKKEKISIVLNLLINNSGRKYVAIFGEGNKTLVDRAGDRVKVNQVLFNEGINETFPIAKKIVLKENLPVEYPVEAAIIKTLDLKRDSYHRLDINDSVHEKSHNLVADTTYSFNLTIDKDDNLLYDLTKQLVK